MRFAFRPLRDRRAVRACFRQARMEAFESNGSPRRSVAICIICEELIKVRRRTGMGLAQRSCTVTKVSHELELKLQLQPGSAQALARIPQLLGKDLAERQRVKEIESLYFDTPQEKLRRRGVSLRIRKDGKRRLQTIKSLKGSALFERGESETEINGKGPDWNAVRGTALEPLASKKLRRSLRPLFKTKVRRTIYLESMLIAVFGAIGRCVRRLPPGKVPGCCERTREVRRRT